MIQIKKYWTWNAITGRKVVMVLSAAFLMAGISPAPGQSVSALKDHNSKQPIDITADELELKQKQNQAIFKGSVQADQGDLQMKAETLAVYYLADAGLENPTITRLDATGGVTLSSPSEKAEGDWAVYDVERRIVTVGGSVVLSQGETIIRGERLELDLESGITKFAGAPEPDPNSETGRVRGKFKVPEKEDN